MAQKDRLTLKSFFQQGDIPTENNYIDLIDSFFTLQDSNSGSLVLTGSIFLSGSNANITASGNISASGDLSMTGNTFIGGNITSSGNISASGNFTAAGLSVGGNIVVQQITASGNISSSATLTANEANITGDITASGDISASGDLEIRNITASGNINASGEFIGASINVTNVTASIVSSSGNIIAANVHLPGGATISFDDSLDGTDQTISGTDDNITIDGDEKIKLRADDVIEIQNTSAQNTIIISPNGGHITASGNISASGADYTFGTTQILNGNITASGNISASVSVLCTSISFQPGMFIRNDDVSTGAGNIFFSDGIEVSGNITASNDITLEGTLTAVSGNFQHISSSFIKTNNLVLSGSDGTEVVLNITNNSYSAGEADVGIQFKRKGNVVASDGQTVIEEAGKILASPAGNYNSSPNVDSNLEFYTMNNNTQSLHLTLDNVGNVSASGTGSFINLALPGFSDVSSSLAAALAGGDNLGNHIATQTLKMGATPSEGNPIMFITTASGYVEADGSAYAMLLSARLGSKTETHIDLSLDRGIILFASSSTNKNIIEIHGNVTASGTFDLTNAPIVSDITASGDISASGNIISPSFRFGGGQKFATALAPGRISFGNNGDSSVDLTHVTASGNISASGNVIANFADFDSTIQVGLGGTNTDGIKIGSASPSFLTNINGLRLQPNTADPTNASTAHVTVGAGAHITASGNISASGDLLSDNLTVVSVTNTDRLQVDQIDAKPTSAGITTTSNITSSGAISASGAIFTSDLNVNYAALPTSDPSVKGQIYRNGSNQLFVSAG